MTERCVACFTLTTSSSPRLMTRRVVVDVDYVLVDDVNYDQTTRLNHTVLTDQMRPVRIIVSTLSKKIARNFLRILPFYLFIYYR